MKAENRKIEKEKRIIARMIRLYCRYKERNPELCPACEALLLYTHQRLDRCPFGEKKRACRQCTIHCYKPEMRERIRRVMRFSGPRMIFYAPMTFFKHLFSR
ncbi:MAG TPA: nitrous oxide-stimulated promoter family protein [Candidatus Gallibacteroides avistercoris]|uniref:Nitrous oxide-stimulated promoter family protein n=1 Tax=Candidatus Gallibacteroides avistercoris TaxID=2840833 RepID=A0A9D1SC61_9BACT|nr:nitrous oxide-stimulated promoter family protein [Candidatus Gallibacteroides avistercoris]